MTPDALFNFAGALAMLGWAVLLLAPFAPLWAEGVAGLAIPGALSLAYTVLIAVHWADAPGGFGSLADVQALFTAPWIALAGWVHYLAFDLFVGTWIVRTARTDGIPHLLVLPLLPLTLLFGPAGLAAFLALRAARAPFATA